MKCSLHSKCRFFCHHLTFSYQMLEQLFIYNTQCFHDCPKHAIGCRKHLVVTFYHCTLLALQCGVNTGGAGFHKKIKKSFKYFSGSEYIHKCSKFASLNITHTVGKPVECQQTCHREELKSAVNKTNYYF